MKPEKNKGLVPVGNDRLDILEVPKYSRGDVLALTELSSAQLKNMLERGHVTLRHTHNPGTGRPRLFCGSDILKITTAHIASGIGFPMHSLHLMADEIENIAELGLLGLDDGDNSVMVMYRLETGEWSRLSLRAEEEPNHHLPAAYQLLRVNQLIEETLGKLKAAPDRRVDQDRRKSKNSSDQPNAASSEAKAEMETSEYVLPDFVRSHLEDPTYDRWTKDEEGRDTYCGLSYDETIELIELQRLGTDSATSIGRRMDLESRHELARRKLAETKFEQSEASPENPQWRSQGKSEDIE